METGASADGRSSSLVGSRPSLQSGKDDGKVSSGAVAALIAVMGAGEGQLDEAFEAHFQAAVDAPVVAEHDGVSSETEKRVEDGGGKGGRNEAMPRLDDPSTGSLPAASRVSLHGSTSAPQMLGVVDDPLAVACLPACWWRCMDPASWLWSLPSPALLARTESRLAGLPFVLNGYCQFSGYYAMPKNGKDYSASVGVPLAACPRSLLKAAAALGAAAVRRRGASLRSLGRLVAYARKASMKHQQRAFKAKNALESQMRARSDLRPKKFSPLGHADMPWAIVPALIRLPDSMPLMQAIESYPPHAGSTERAALAFGGGVDFRHHICGEGHPIRDSDVGSGEVLSSRPPLRRDLSRSSGLEEAHMVSADVPSGADGSHVVDGQHLMRSAMAEAEALHRRRWDAAEAKPSSPRGSGKSREARGHGNKTASGSSDSGDDHDASAGGASSGRASEIKHAVRYGYATTEAEIVEAQQTAPGLLVAMLVPGVLHEGGAGGAAASASNGGQDAPGVDSSNPPYGRMKRSLSGRSLTDDHTDAEKAAMVADAVKGVPEAVGDDEKAPWSSGAGATPAVSELPEGAADGSDGTTPPVRVSSGDAWPKL